MCITAAGLPSDIPVSTIPLFKYVKYASPAEVKAMVMKKPITQFMCGLINPMMRLNTGAVKFEVYSSSSSSSNSSDIFVLRRAQAPARAIWAEVLRPCISSHACNFNFQLFIDPRLDIVDLPIDASFMGH